VIDINNIAVPSITHTKYEELKDALVKALQAKMPDYVPHESDVYMPLIEAAAYRELILRERINTAIKSMLLPSAEGADLDLVAARYGVQRNPGEKSQAEITLTLSTTFTQDTLIPAGTMLTDNSYQHFGRIMQDIVIAAGEEKATGTIELDEYAIESYAETIFFVNPRPYIKQAKHTKYVGGLPPEEDSAFRKRILQSLERFTTAGSVESYIYHAMSTSTLVRDVYVSTPAPGDVLVMIQVPHYSADTDADKLAALCQEVYEAVSGDRVRPLTDHVYVQPAEPYNITVVADIELYDIHQADQTLERIKTSLTDKNWGLGESLNLSYLYKMLHADNVYRVELVELRTADGALPLDDVNIAKSKYISLAYEFSYKAATI
jgi:phage-related baseplate assembly protein